MLRPTLYWFLWLTLAACAGCDRIEDGGRARFGAAVQPFCALWGETQLSLGRLGTHCPWGPASGAPAPCAIEHYLGDSQQPRTVRRLACDELARPLRVSDHRGDQAVAAWQYQYEPRGESIIRHRYRISCEAPAPEFQGSQTFEADDLGVLARWPLGGSALQATGRIESGVLSDEAWLEASMGKQRYALRIDASGNVVGRRSAAGQVSLSQTKKDGRVVHEVIPGLHPGRNVEVRYAYDDGGRLQELSLVGPAGQRQRYRFRYSCDAAPSCAPEGTGRDEMPFDPELLAFRPSNCSEQAAFSPNLCDVVARQGSALQLSCCRSAPDRISAIIESPLARTAVTYMRLETASGTTLESLDCTPSRETSNAAWRCEFGRGALAMLPEEPATLALMTDSNQGVLNMATNLQVWLKASQ